MKYSVLKDFLQFLLSNNIELTLEEKKFLQNTPPDISLSDLLKWYKSDLRRNKEALDILYKFEITKKNFQNLIKLKEHEIDKLLKKYDFVNEKDKSFALIAFADLQNSKCKNKKRKKQITEHNENIVDILVKGSSKRKENKLKIIKNNAIYYDINLIREIAAKKNINIDDFINIENFLDKFEGISSDFVRKVISLTVNSPCNERFHINRIINRDPEEVKKFTTKKRAMQAFMKQDSFDKAEEVITTSFNGNIYRNKKLFELLQNQETKEKMKNLKSFYILNKENRHDCNLLVNFSMLDEESQKSIINQLAGNLNDKKKSQDEQIKKEINEYEKAMDRTILEFFSPRGTVEKTAKKLVKKLDSPYFYHIKDKNTKTN